MFHNAALASSTFGLLALNHDGNQITRVGQNRIFTPYMTVYLVISLPKIPYSHRIYMVLANPTNHLLGNMLKAKMITKSLVVRHAETINIDT
jgi:hypothetical protein